MSWIYKINKNNNNNDDDDDDETHLFKSLKISMRGGIPTMQYV